MFRLDDWIAEPKFVKKYSNRSIAALYTRSVSGQGRQHGRVFSLFAFKI